MSLAQTVIDQIRDEIGTDPDFTDETPAGDLGDLETIYNDVNRGDSDVLRTALICWKRRLGAIQSRSFDVTTGGALYSRSQRVRHFQRRIKELEIRVDYTLVGVNQSLISAVKVAEDAAVAEF